MVKRALLSMQTAGLRRALNSWLACAGAAAEARRRLAASASEWSGSKRRACWQAWCEVAASRNQLQQAARRLRSVGLTRVLGTWLEAAAQNVARGECMTGILRNLCHGATRRALNSWTSLCLGRARARRAGSAFCNGSLRLGLLGWASAVSAAGEQRRQVGRAVASLRAAGVRRALNSWLACAAAAGEQRRQVGRAVASLRAAGVRRALNSWSACAAAAAEARRRLAAAASEWAGSKRRACWQAWYETVVALRRLKRAARRLRSVGLTRAFDMWLEAVQRLRSRLDGMRSVLGSLRQVNLRRSLSTWAAALTEARRRVGMFRLAAAAQLHPLARGLRAWVDGAIRSAKKSLRRHRHTRRDIGSLRRGFESWTTTRHRRALSCHVPGVQDSPVASPRLSPPGTWPGVVTRKALFFGPTEVAASAASATSAASTAHAFPTASTTPIGELELSNARACEVWHSQEMARRILMLRIAEERASEERGLESYRTRLKGTISAQLGTLKEQEGQLHSLMRAADQGAADMGAGAQTNLERQFSDLRAAAAHPPLV